VLFSQSLAEEFPMPRVACPAPTTGTVSGDPDRAVVGRAVPGGTARGLGRAGTTGRTRRP